MPDVYHVKGLKYNLLSIGKLIQKGYRVYMEDNHCVIKDIRLRNQLIARVPVKRNHLFPLRIMPYMKGKTNIGVAFKIEIKESNKHCDKKEKDNTKIQAVCQSEVEDESWLWHFIFGHLNFGGINILHTKNMLK